MVCKAGEKQNGFKVMSKEKHREGVPRNFFR